MALHESQRPRKWSRLIAALRPGFTVPANARFVIEDERQTPSSNPVYLFRHGLWLITPLSWLLFALNLMGYFFLSGWTPTLLTAAKLPPATAALAAALAASRRHGRRAVAVLVAAAASLPRHLASVRARGPGRRLDRLCRTDVASRLADRDILRRLHRARHPDRHQRRRRHALPDVAARQRLGLATRPRPHRLDRRPARRRAVRRHAGAAALHVVGVAICRRRRRLLRHPRAQHGAAQGASRNWRRRSKPKIKTARSRAAPGSPSRRTAGSSASDRAPAGRRN